MRWLQKSRLPLMHVHSRAKSSRSPSTGQQLLVKTKQPPGPAPHTVAPKLLWGGAAHAFVCTCPLSTHSECQMGCLPLPLLVKIQPYGPAQHTHKPIVHAPLPCHLLATSPLPPYTPPQQPPPPLLSPPPTHTHTYIHPRPTHNPTHVCQVVFQPYGPSRSCVDPTQHSSRGTTDGSVARLFSSGLQHHRLQGQTAQHSTAYGSSSTAHNTTVSSGYNLHNLLRPPGHHINDKLERGDNSVSKHHNRVGCNMTIKVHTAQQSLVACSACAPLCAASGGQYQLKSTQGGAKTAGFPELASVAVVSSHS